MKRGEWCRHRDTALGRYRRNAWTQALQCCPSGNQQESSTHSAVLLDWGSLCTLRRFCNPRFYHTSLKGTQFKMYDLPISEFSHLIFAEGNRLWVTEALLLYTLPSMFVKLYNKNNEQEEVAGHWIGKRTVSAWKLQPFLNSITRHTSLSAAHSHKPRSLLSPEGFVLSSYWLFKGFPLVKK